VLLARGVDVALVVTHEDNPSENIWFGSVASVAAEHGIPVVTPADPSDPALRRAVSDARPDFIFSFYYRHMLPVDLLAIAPRGAYNMHGSLLPKYRGRVPTNWAVLNGETETGATLHEMAAKPDAGAILGQTAVPMLPALLAGDAPHLPNDLASGSYYGGRKPEDGRIDWSKPAAQVYNLVRAVAPPYPGAFTDVGGTRFVIARARLAAPGSAAATAAANLPAGLHVSDNALFGVCGDSRALSILELWQQRDGSETVVTPAEFAQFIHSSRHS